MARISLCGHPLTWQSVTICHVTTANVSSTSQVLRARNITVSRSTVSACVCSADGWYVQVMLSQTNCQFPFQSKMPPYRYRQYSSGDMPVLVFSTQWDFLNRHQTILAVYVNKVGKTSVVWRYTLQSIRPSGIALNH